MKRSKTDWDRLKSMTDDDIQKAIESDPDTLEASAEFWQNATMIMPSGENKKQITLRIDADILNFFKNNGKGYQSKINAVLRSYIENVNQL
jgi:uncharacterized protein (DUF4415 family)